MKQNNQIENIKNYFKKNKRNFKVIYEIKSGKEATIYKILLDEKVYAMKVYKDLEKRTFRNNSNYLTGKFYKKASHRKAVEKKNNFSKKLKYNNWVKREFFILKKLYKLGANVPKVFLQEENFIVMEFIGDEKVASRLSELKFEKKLAGKLFKKIISNIKIFWKFGIIHGDLSEYNILYYDEKPIIIDFPQAIDKKNNPEMKKFLKRDISNICKYFSKFIEINNDEILKDFQIEY